MTDIDAASAAPAAAAAPDAAPCAPAAGPAPATPAGPESPPAESAGWRDALDPDLRAYAERFASPGEAVRSARELRRKLSTAVQVPGPDADPSARLAVFDRLGRPETADGYTLPEPEALPEWVSLDDETVQAAQRSFLEAMHGAGATQEMVEAALGWYWRQLGDAESSRDRQIEAEIAAADAGLRREWGGEFERNLALAGRAAAAFGGRDLGDLLDQYGLSNHPAVVRAFARIGRSMGEDDMISGSVSEATREQLREQAEKLVAQDDYWTNESLQREMRQIMLQLYGEKEIGPGAA